MRVLFAAFEAVPFMKTGGLGDVGGSLPQALKEAGCEVRVMIPKFMTIPEAYKNQMTHVTDFRVNLGWRNLYCGVEKLTYKGVIYYFLDNEYYFMRDKAYGYYDDGERIAFFSKAIVESLQYLPDFKCDVLHCNDWHTALAPVFLREFYQGIPLYENVKTVLTIHNLKFQGQMSDFVLGDVLGLEGIPAAANQLRSDRDSVNFMKGGLLYSDILSTVSKTYAQEIQSEFFGEHMEGIFRARSSVLYGIMNGIDTAEYDPEKDAKIAAPFTISDLSGKAACKTALQQELGLEVDPNVPLIVMIGRLTDQKGLDLVKCVMDDMMAQPLQLAVLGTGDAQYENMLRHYAWKYSGKLAAQITFNEPLSHRMYAGADMLLMPSLFEPCGLSQMIAMRYGTLPVVRETGGLKDSVVPYNQYTGEGTGFSFANYNAHEMLATIVSAVNLYRENKKAWGGLMDNAMNADFSWTKAAEEYLDMYHRTHPEMQRWKKPSK
ncbi:MAG: glycogen synthase GlgA [Oscillospiraceae bacterium]